MIFNMVGGGGAGGASIFIVNSVNERPTNVFNNTLWVNTDVDVVKYVFSDNEPSNPTEGMLWLTISNSDNVNVAAPINKDWMKFNLGIVRQYIDGVWERKFAQLYKDGIWVDVSKIFVAYIDITYPANSNCVVTNPSGQIVANDTNATSSPQTFTAIVGATGTYTVTATATDGSGKSKSQSVNITTEGQFENVALSYQLHLFKAGEGLASGYSIAKSGALTVSKSADAITLTRSELTTNGQAYFNPPIDCSQFTKLTVVAKQTEIYDMYGATLVRLLAGTTAEQNGTAAVSKKLNQSGATTCDFDLSAIDEVLYLNIGCFRGTSCEITNILFT